MQLDRCLDRVCMCSTVVDCLARSQHVHGFRMQFFRNCFPFAARLLRFRTNCLDSLKAKTGLAGFAHPPLPASLERRKVPLSSTTFRNFVQKHGLPFHRSDVPLFPFHFLSVFCRERTRLEKQRKGLNL